MWFPILIRWHLYTESGPWWRYIMVMQNWVNNGQNVAFTWGQFHRKCTILYMLTSILDLSLKMTNPKSQLHLSGANELRNDYQWILSETNQFIVITIVLLAWLQTFWLEDDNNLMSVKNTELPANTSTCSLDSLWHSNAIWWHRSESTLAQVMACCLMASSHCLNQCWINSPMPYDITIRPRWVKDSPICKLWIYGSCSMKITITVTM